jgi:hypothetical protein
MGQVEVRLKLGHCKNDLSSYGAIVFKLERANTRPHEGVGRLLTQHSEAKIRPPISCHLSRVEETTSPAASDSLLAHSVQR